MDEVSRVWGEEEKGGGGGGWREEVKGREPCRESSRAILVARRARPVGGRARLETRSCWRTATVETRDERWTWPSKFACSLQQAAAASSERATGPAPSLFRPAQLPARFAAAGTAPSSLHASGPSIKGRLGHCYC